MLNDLRVLREKDPSLAGKISTIEKYLQDLDKLVAFPKIIQVTKDKIVEKEKAVPVIVTRRDEDSIKSEAFYIVLIEKLLNELKRIK